MSSRRIPVLTSDDVATWSASKINAMIDRLSKARSRNTDDFIAAGRGHERPSDYMSKDDPLSREAQAIYEAQSVCRAEVERRYGPGAPTHLPRGFGPVGGRP